ncbi:hypothetical protein AMJ85_08975 [candidate division BRC1 bacterium SM23_51]|nr:MAG: hypothetical protein AMJ85_08975 [candidate division BRC1 bacterium SM23_51]
MEDYIQVFTTTETKNDAHRIARTIVEKRLAACGQIIGPITSIYWWKGKIETAEEWICVLKSSMQLYEELETAVREIHSYDVPEILAVPITAGSQSYLDWLSKELKRNRNEE